MLVVLYRFNGFDVPIKILGVTLEDEPTSNMKLVAHDIPPHDALQPGQSLTTAVLVGTAECALQRYAFKRIFRLEMRQLIDSKRQHRKA